MKEGVKAVVLAVAVGVIAFMFGRDTAPKPTVVTQIDTVIPQAFQDALQDARLEVGSLRSRLEGIRPVTPVTILRTDTLVLPPDTVVQFFRITGGQITVAPLVRRDSLWAPEISTYRVGNCDESLSFQDGQLICDPARLGHLWLGLGVDAGTDGVYPTLAAMWKPSYRSPWFVSMQSTGIRHSLWVQRSVQIF